MIQIKAINTKGKTETNRMKLLWSFFNGGRLTDYMVEQLGHMGFFKSPASTKYHGNYEGGLFDHSINVYRCLEELRESSLAEPFPCMDSTFMIGLLHDLTKAGRYVFSHDGTGYEYAPARLDFGGHGADSLIKAQRLVQLDEEEAYCIRYHMGPYVKEDIELYDRAIHKYPNVFWTHTADMMASQLMED